MTTDNNAPEDVKTTEDFREFDPAAREALRRRLQATRDGAMSPITHGDKFGHPIGLALDGEAKTSSTEGENADLEPRQN